MVLYLNLKIYFSAHYYLLLKSYSNKRSFRVKLETCFFTFSNVLVGVSRENDIAPFLNTLQIFQQLKIL